MKKHCNGKGRRVHPAPPPPAVGLASLGHLAALPAAVLVLAAALAPEEQEVLAYLLGGGGGGGGARGGLRWRPHPPELGCGCFGCYKSFWARWDASPNSQLIHQIIDAVEEGAEMKDRRRRGGDRRRRRSCPKGDDLMVPEAAAVAEGGSSGAEEDEDDREEDGVEVDDGAAVGSSGNFIDTKNSVRRLMRFIGERVWGAWN